MAFSLARGTMVPRYWARRGAIDTCAPARLLFSTNAMGMAARAIAGGDFSRWRFLAFSPVRSPDLAVSKRRSLQGQNALFYKYIALFWYRTQNGRMAAPVSSRERQPLSPIGAAVIGSVMEPAFVRRTWSIADERRAPRGHAFFAIRGRASFEGESRTVELKAPFILWLPSPSRGEFRLGAGGEGIALSVLDDFLWRIVGGSGLAAHLRPLLDRIAVATPDRIAPQLDELEASFSALARESHDHQPGASVAIGLHLGIVLIGLWRASGPDASNARGAGTAQRFRQLVELHYRECMGIDGFARLLGVTRSHLHDACVRSAGATPLGLVQERLAEEACRRLEETELSVEQIGYSLGFRDPGYFNRFFKRRRTLAPGAYRKAARVRDGADDSSSFAAWP
jgi:AraC family transcriptional regulator, transcriptional activator of pobA